MINKGILLNISKKLFLILVFLIPVNLGKHFEIIDSYLNGVLIDYLVPTVFIQDILSLCIILTWVFGKGVGGIVSDFKVLFKRNEVKSSALFIFALFLSSLFSIKVLPSLYDWAHLFLYFLIFLYILSEIPVEEYLFKVLDFVSVSVLLVSLLGIIQFFLKGSVFDNYIFFGEQPYSSSTPGVVKEYFLGSVVMPSYGLFRHPNVFGGFLSVTLLWIYCFKKKRKFYTLSLLLGIAALFFTFSYGSWLVFIFGITAHSFLLNTPVKTVVAKKYLIGATALSIVLLTILPLTKKFRDSDNPDLYRRHELAVSSISIAREYPIFGVGFNSSTALIEKYKDSSKDIVFTQPVHNIGLLVLSEGGWVSLISFLLFLFVSIRKLLNSSYFHLFLVSFMQILLLGSFDHYFITAHQTLLLFWIILAFSFQ